MNSGYCPPAREQLSSESCSRSQVRLILCTDLAHAAPVLGQLSLSFTNCISGERIYSDEATGGSETHSDLNRGVELRSLKKGIDTRTAAGKFHYQIWGAMAEFEQARNLAKGTRAHSRSLLGGLIGVAGSQGVTDIDAVDRAAAPLARSPRTGNRVPSG